MQLDLSAPKVVTFKYQLDPCIDGIGTQPLLPLLSRFLFHGGREVDARNPDAGLGDGVSHEPVGEPVQTGPRLG